MKNKFKVFSWVGILVVLIALLTSCSNKTSVQHMVYHDVTLRYNYYFNAKLILNETIKNEGANHEDDYNEILDLYTYIPTGDASGLNPVMNDAIKRASIGVQLHENSKWVDDSYLIIGKAEFMKKDFEAAVQAFQVITSDYDEGVREKEPPRVSRKRFQQLRKDDTRNMYYDPFLSFLKHKPARWEALVWIIRSYSQLGRFVEAQSIISFAKGDKTFPDELKGDLEVAITDFYLKKKEYSSAANSLKTAISLTDDKDKQTRYTFILAQIYQQIDLHTQAIEHYQAVLELRPDYEMEFNAKINIANISREMQSSTDEDIIALLHGMLENDKYRMFKGQIYYALAEIYLKDQRNREAIDALKKAVRHSDDDPGQQSQAYLKLADIYFEREAYLESKAYHDSTLNILSSEDPGYEDINLRKMVLQDLADNVDIIELEDSLQKLSLMSDAELQAMLDDQRKEEEEVEDMMDDPFQTNDPDGAMLATNWPFDNPTSRGNGYMEFKRLWGDRPLQDNWRRADAGTIVDGTTIDDGLLDPTDPDDPATLESLKEQLPTTPEQIDASNDRIIDAYYALSNIYRNRLNNEPKSAETLEEMMERFPENEYRNEAAYRLYLFYEETDPALAKKYKDVVLTEFPESILARLIENPGYLEASKEQEQNINRYYASTFTMFEKMDYGQVMKRVQESDSLFPDNHMQAKFDMLQALSLGKMGLRDSFQKALQEIVNKYPDNEVRSRAMDILNLMEGGKYGDDVGITSNYKVQPNKPHHVMIIFNEITKENEEIKGNLSNYNTEYHEPEKLQVASMMLDNNTQFFLVKGFSNAAKAESYYNEIRYSKKIFPDTDSKNHQVFIVSDHNFGVFFREKDIPEYMKFFTDNYLNND